MTIKRVKLSRRTRAAPTSLLSSVCPEPWSLGGTCMLVLWAQAWGQSGDIRTLLVLWFQASQLSRQSLSFLLFCKKELRIHTPQEFCKVWSRIPYTLKAQQMMTTYHFHHHHSSYYWDVEISQIYYFKMCCMIRSEKWSWVMHSLLGRLGAISEHSGPLQQ